MKKVLMLCAVYVMAVNAYSSHGSDTIIVPSRIQTSFVKLYPNARNVVWYRYTPPNIVVEPGVWYSTMDTSDYYSRFFWNDDEYIAWYDNGSWIHSTQRIDDSEIPDAVSQAIRREYPGFVITDVDIEHEDKQRLYEVKLDKGNTRWNVLYTPTGAVVKKKLKTLSKVDAEAAMVSDFESRYPNASTVTWYRYAPADRIDVLPSDWDYSMDENDFEVRYTLDGSDYAAYYDNGRWVRSEALTFDRTKLPTSVSNAINSQYAGYTIKDVDREDDANQVVYEVELVKANEKCKIHYSTAGNIVKKKCKTK
ncbi:PepSY-like domain-containing protein [Lacibacter sp. H375]|uniref:PepSY-like domain-containing protein n=1 Tax=Lacibacter sp. H375 TaxID=3133424 RepID=UPI0030BDE2F0